MAGRPYNYDQKQINFLYYPSEPEDYQRLFLKMEVFSDRSQKRIADSIIYLPLPQDDPLQRQPDILLAHKELNGWKPKIDLYDYFLPFLSKIFSIETAFLC